MAFLLLFLSGLFGGVLGGMGMGGGTALIPLLTLLCGLPQAAAQGINLLSFLPMSFLALSVHAKSGLVKKRGLLLLILPALLFSALFALFAGMLPSSALKKGFGAFLILLSFLPLKGALSKEGGGSEAHKKVL